MMPRFLACAIRKVRVSIHRDEEKICRRSKIVGEKIT